MTPLQSKIHKHIHIHIRNAVRFILHIFNSNIIRSIYTRTHSPTHAQERTKNAIYTYCCEHPVNRIDGPLVLASGTRGQREEGDRIDHLSNCHSGVYIALCSVNITESSNVHSRVIILVFLCVGVACDGNVPAQQYLFSLATPTRGAAPSILNKIFIPIKIFICIKYICLILFNTFFSL